MQYYNGYNFTWTNGTELATAVNSNYSLSFSYDDNGVRVRKTVNGVDHFYTVNGTQILTERWVADQVEHLLVYLYDASGSPIGMEYRNNTYPESGFDLYLFETNLMGDIIGVYNELGEKLISYTYDAWGNCTMIASTNVTAGSDFAAAFNPFRYRGYYYDTELGLYYLNARYYDPNTGRFISPDPKYISTGQGINGSNMYAYCLNNPVMMIDPTGEIAITTALIIILISATVGGAVFGGVSAAMNGGDAKDILVGVGKGAANGFILGSAVSMIVGGCCLGPLSPMGAPLLAYGARIVADQINVGFTQGRKSHSDGDNFWAGANDVNNSLFANSPKIVGGSIELFGIEIEGSLLATKIPWAFRISRYSSNLSNYLLATNSLASASTFSMLLHAGATAAGFAFSAVRCIKAVEAIFTPRPNFENSEWILF